MKVDKTYIVGVGAHFKKKFWFSPTKKILALQAPHPPFSFQTNPQNHSISLPLQVLSAFLLAQAKTHSLELQGSCRNRQQESRQVLFFPLPFFLFIDSFELSY